MSVPFLQSAFGEYVSLVVMSREHEKYMLLDCAPDKLYSHLMSFPKVAKVMQQLNCSPTMFIEFMTADPPLTVANTKAASNGGKLLQNKWRERTGSLQQKLVSNMFRNHKIVILECF